MPILQINFKFDVPLEEYQHICQSVAQAIADLPGLRWKIWILNEREKEAGGIYLFASEQAIHDYLSGPIVAQVKSHPGFRELSAKQFDVMDDVTAITRGPLSAVATAR